MKTSELQKLIREEIRKVLKEVKAINNPNEIRSKLDKKMTGIYVLHGGLNSDGSWDEASLKKANPVFYTSELRTNKSDLIKAMESLITIVDIDQNGNIDVANF